MARLLEVKNLSAGIKRGEKILKAVDSVNFHINEGEILGLAGESGCGKTMTALSIANLLPHTVKILDGEIIFNGKDLTHLSEKQMCAVRGKEISVIFQELRESLNPLLKIGSQIAESLELAGNRDRESNKKRVIEILCALGFEEPEKTFNAYPHQLSGGMCQRVITAIAAICRPRLLLADEPSSALDEESQNKIMSLLLDLNRDFNTSVLVISHDLSVIRKYCSRYLVMYAGKIAEEGQAGSFFSPLHPYTHALVGAIPNHEKRGQSLENIPGKVPSIEDRFSGCPFAPRCRKAEKICGETFPPAIETGDGKVYCFFPNKAF